MENHPLFKENVDDIVHSKNTWVKLDPEKCPLGPNSIPGQE